MHPISEFPPEVLRSLRIILCDIDDTLTHEGLLPAVSYTALERLHQAGLKTIPVTGRPAGWCDHIARMWPVDGVVGENGAFWFRYDHAKREMQRAYWRSLDHREADRATLSELGRQILKQVPGSAISADQSYREADLAIDFCEDVPRLPDSAIADIVRMFEDAGAVAKVSSIHVNGWFGDYDKLSMTRRLLCEAFDWDIDRERRAVAFVGDSPNDEPMFGFFENAVGVANIAPFAPHLTHPPQWITVAQGGYGFAEFAEMILAAKGFSSARNMPRETL